MPHVKVGNRRMSVPKQPWLRVVLGIAFVIGGMGFVLPVLGLWMIPLGLVLLSWDVGVLRRWRRVSSAKFERWRRARAANASP